jgi:hypothetical protein
MKKPLEINVTHLLAILFLLSSIIEFNCAYGQTTIQPSTPSSIILTLKLKLNNNGQLTGIFPITSDQLKLIKEKNAQLEVTIPKNVLVKGYKYIIGNATIDSKRPVILDSSSLSKLDTSHPITISIYRKGKNDTLNSIAGSIQITLKNPQASDNVKIKKNNVLDDTNAIYYTEPVNSDTTYVIKHYIKLATCDQNGIINTDDSIWIKGTDNILFKKEWNYKKVLNGDTQTIAYIIHILNWKKPTGHPNLRKQNLKKNWKYVYDRSTPGYERSNTFPANDSIVPKFFLFPTDPVYASKSPLDTINKVTFTNFNIQSLPAKLRFGSDKTLHHPDDNAPYQRRFDVSSGISLGAAYGPRFNLDRGKGNFFLSLLLGVSVGTVNVDSSTTDNKSGSTKTAGAFTLYGGITFEYKNFQLGLFTGGDYLFGGGDINRDWNYRNQPWLGIGIGYSLFSNTQNISGQTNK